VPELRPADPAGARFCGECGTPLQASGNGPAAITLEPALAGRPIPVAEPPSPKERPPSGALPAPIGGRSFGQAPFRST